MKKHSILKSFSFAFKGFKTAWPERNFRLHLISATAVVLLGFYFHITHMEWTLILLCIGSVLSLELINTAIEQTIDMISPGYNENAGRIKDLAAAAVLISSIIALVIGLVIFLPHLY